MDFNGMPFFQHLLPSVCKTASPGFTYVFYINLGFDPIATKAFQDKCSSYIARHCTDKSVYEWRYSRAANPLDVFMNVYIDDVDYVIKLYDHTILQSPKWTESLIFDLQERTVSNFGIVFLNNSAMLEEIPSVQFVHKTHFDIFGFFAPRVLVKYELVNKWLKEMYNDTLTNGDILFSSGSGMRFVNPPISALTAQLSAGKLALEKYQKMVVQEKHPRDGKKVIGFSLFGNQARWTYGAIQNARLAPLFYPGWTPRYFIEDPSVSKAPDAIKRIARKLESLNADVRFMNYSKIKNPRAWRFALLDDETVEIFICRDTDSRPGLREVAAVNEWLQTNAVAHCMRDHGGQISVPIQAGMWGGRRKAILQLIGNQSVVERIAAYKAVDFWADAHFLGNVLWPKIKPYIYCHDSFGCQKFPNSHPFPTKRNGLEFVGAVYDPINEVSIARDIIKFKKNPPNPLCEQNFTSV